MSEWGSYVVPLNLEKHPNADSLSIVRLKEPLEATVVVRTDDWKGLDRAVWILPDSVTGDHEIFDWYGRQKKTKTIKLRGVMSYGFFIPALPYHRVGDEVSAAYGVTKYEEPIKRVSLKGEEQENSPSKSVNYTDIENIRNSKYSKDLFQVGESVVLLEKCDGSNARFLYTKEGLKCGSHYRWLREYFKDDKQVWALKRSWWKRLLNKMLGWYEPQMNRSKSQWWKMADRYNLKEKLAKYPGYMFVGEMFGNRVNILKYFEEKGRIELAFYDIYDTAAGRYLDWPDALKIFKGLELPVVPILYEGPFESYDSLKPLADNGSKVPDAKDICEGWIIRPLLERYEDRVGRVILKYKTDEYLSL